MSLFAPLPTARMPYSHKDREAQARLKLHMLMARLRSAVRAFLISGRNDDRIWGSRLLEEIVCDNYTFLHNALTP